MNRIGIGDRGLLIFRGGWMSGRVGGDRVGMEDEGFDWRIWDSRGSR